MHSKCNRNRSVVYVLYFYFIMVMNVYSADHLSTAWVLPQLGWWRENGRTDPPPKQILSMPVRIRPTCQILQVVWPENQRRYIRGGLYEFFDGEELLPREGCGFPKTEERAAVVVKIVVWGEFSFPSNELYQDNATYHLPNSCMFACAKNYKQ